jgi:hypothetical protein
MDPGCPGSDAGVAAIMTIPLTSVANSAGGWCSVTAHGWTRVRRFRGLGHIRSAGGGATGGNTDRE